MLEVVLSVAVPAGPVGVAVLEGASRGWVVVGTMLLVAAVLVLVGVFGVLGGGKTDGGIEPSKSA